MDVYRMRIFGEHPICLRPCTLKSCAIVTFSGTVFENLDFNRILHHARTTHKLPDVERLVQTRIFMWLEKIKTPLSQGRKNSTISTTASSGRNCRQLPDLANKGLKMALALVCPHFMREKGLAKDSKCGKLFEAMCIGILDERLIRFLWLFYELSGEVQDPKLFSRNPV